MNYTTEIVVDLPLVEFIKKLDNPENMKHWMRNLISYESIKGVAGEEGSQTTLTFKQGKGEMSMVETVVKKDLPTEIHLTYEAKSVYNLQKNYFTAIGDNQTKWTVVSDFKFQSIFLKLLAFFMPSIFKKQSEQYAQDFKAFAEDGTSVAN